MNYEHFFKSLSEESYLSLGVRRHFNAFTRAASKSYQFLIRTILLAEGPSNACEIDMKLEFRFSLVGC